MNHDGIDEGGGMVDVDGDLLHQGCVDANLHL